MAQTDRSLQTVPIEDMIAGLREIPEKDFVCDVVYEYLDQNPVDAASLEKYLFWSDKFYTRNLIFKNDLFEVMAICWEKGMASRIHNHYDQRCWMTVPIGKLHGQNFAVLEMDEENGRCKLKPTDSFNIADCAAVKVELEEPIHQVLNLPEFNERAVSIHIYSKPYDRCLSYCTDTDTYKEVKLFYTSIKGQLCDGIVL